MEKEPHSTFMLGDRSYDFIKKLVQIVLPAISAAYFSLAGIWDLPEPEKVVGTLAVVTTFLGVCLGVSTAQYNASGKAYDGQLNIVPQPDGPTRFDLVTNQDPRAIVDKKSITFKVNTDINLVKDQLLAPTGSGPGDDPLDEVSEPAPEAKRRRVPRGL